MPLTEATAMLIGSGIAAGTGAANSVFAGVRGKKNREAQERYNEQQQKNWQEQFNYQKFLNENQYTIQAKDQTKAGINPIAANGGTVNGFSATTGGQAATSEAPKLDTSGLIGIIQQSAQLKHDSYERAKDRENAKKIAEINAEASNNAAELSNEGTHYSTDIQAAIAAENRKTQKQIADDNRAAQTTISNMDRQSREKIAGWSNQTQKDLQKAQQEWTDSDDHREAAKKLQKALEEAYDYGRELEAMKHLYITADTGKKYRIDDYLKMLEIDARAYENSTTRRSEDTIYRGLDRLLSLFGAITGAAGRR